MPTNLAKARTNKILGLPGTLVLLGLPHDLQRQIAAVIGDSSQMVSVPDVVTAAVQLQKANDACVMLLVPRAASGQGDRDRLLRWHREVPVVAIYDEGFSDCDALLELGRIGVSEVIQKHELSLASVLGDTLRRCEARTVSTQIWNQCADYVPAALATLLLPALSLAHSPTTVARLASILNLAESALETRCENASLPSPNWIIDWARTATLAYFVEHFQCSFADAASILQFRSTVELEQTWRGLTAMGGEGRQLNLGSCVNLLRGTIKADRIIRSFPT